jgi:methionyl-tRNA synthetase
VLYTCLRCVDDLKTMFTPFTPFSSQTLHELLGHDGSIAGPLGFRDVQDDGDEHVVLTGDYGSWVGSWAPGDLPAGQTLREPKPLFRKLDPAKVEEEELKRMGFQDPEAA